jgi:hypothetical protein
MFLKHVLIVTYYWPPAGGPGVQRALKFVKYLPEFGYTPIVLTVENNLQLGSDFSLASEIASDLLVFKERIPFQPEQSAEKKSFVENTNKQRLKRWVRGNILLPDGKIPWYFSCRKLLRHIFSEYKVDCAFITAPPQTSHLIGSFIKKRYGVPTVHDFRDPWTDAFFLKDFNRGKLAHWLDSKLEKNVLKKADHVVTVSDHLSALLKSKTENIKGLTTISNGFDHAINKAAMGEKITTITYTGTIAKSQSPKALFQFLANSPRISLRIYGHVHSEFELMAKSFHVFDQLQIFPPVSHSEIVKIQLNAECLLLLIPEIEHNELIVTGKIFEYFAANRPILGFGPEKGDAANYLTSSKLGKMFRFDAEPQAVQAFFDQSWQADSTYISSFHRRNLTEKLAAVFNTVLTRDLNA